MTWEFLGIRDFPARAVEEPKQICLPSKTSLPSGKYKSTPSASGCFHKKSSVIFEIQYMDTRDAKNMHCTWEQMITGDPLYPNQEDLETQILCATTGGLSVSELENQSCDMRQVIRPSHTTYQTVDTPEA